MSFVRTQTFDIKKDVHDELDFLNAVIANMTSQQCCEGVFDGTTALPMLLARRDRLTAEPQLKDYNQTEALGL